MRTRLYSLLTLLALSLVGGIAPPTKAAPPQPVFQSEEQITPASGSHKFPALTVAKGLVHVVWGTPNQVNYAARAEGSPGFTALQSPGSIGSNSSYFNAATAADKSGVVHVVWIDNGSTIRHRSSPSPNSWSELHTAATGQKFANYIATTISSSGRIFAAWRYEGSNPDGNIAFIFSDNGGVNWSGVADVALPTGSYAGVPSLAAGPSGQVFLTWTGVDGNVYVGEFNGSTFVPVKVTNGKFFNPTVSVTKSGQPVAAWRSIDQGVHVGVRNAAGQWITQNVFQHPGVTGAVSIVADAQDNLHLAWISQIAGGGKFETWYSFKTPTDPWSAPMLVSRDGQTFKANISMTTSISNNAALAHIAWESFASGQFIRYAQVRTQLSVPLSGRLTINNGAAFTKQSQVNLSITNTSAGPATSYSVADGVDPGAPTAAFTNPTTTTTFNLNTSDGLCRAHTVYARLGNGSNVSPLFAATITYDPNAQIVAQARNPNVAFNQPLNDFNSALVPSGSIAYTREERFNLLVNGALGECSGIKRYAIVKKGAAKPAANDPAWRSIVGGYVSANIQFAASSGQGNYEFDVYALDLVDNETPTPTSVQIIFDNEAPTVTGASATMQATTTSKGGIATVNVGAPSVSDNLFTGSGDGKQYWGYWVVVKRSSAGTPSTSDWESYGEIRAGELPSTLRWNIADGMVGAFVPNDDYTIYIRYLDGAGNGSASMKSSPIRVTQLEYFMHMPISSR